MHSIQNVSNAQLIQKSITMTSRSSSFKSLKNRYHDDHESNIHQEKKSEKTTQQKMKNQKISIEIFFIFKIEFERFDEYRDD